MYSMYSLIDTINNFFESQSTVTREQCDQLAISLVDGPINPVPIQGAFSYTVVAGAEQNKIVQFRAQSSIFDMEIMKKARKIHGQYVPDCAYHGTVGQSQPLSVYVMEKLPGITYIQGRSADVASRRYNVVVDFAKFFAASWKHKQTKRTNEIEAIHRDYRQKIDLLAQALPSRFAGHIKKIRKELPLLFTKTYPLVFTHDDLCEMNILVDPVTGHLKGIIDWADAGIFPFGMSLWALQNMLGYMDSQGWHYFSNHEKLESLFWQAFAGTVGGISDADWAGIRVARLAGYLLRYGFVWEDEGEVPAKDSDVSIKYLDAFFATGVKTALQ